MQHSLTPDVDPYLFEMTDVWRRVHDDLDRRVDQLEWCIRWDDGLTFEEFIEWWGTCYAVGLAFNDFISAVVDLALLEHGGYAVYNPHLNRQPVVRHRRWGETVPPRRQSESHSSSTHASPPLTGGSSS